jgi:tyrosyl-tRNA synthetase
MNEARRVIAEGGAYVNNVRVTDAEQTVDPSDLLHDKWLVVRRGKRTIAGVELAR